MLPTIYIKDYDYELPSSRIARYPTAQRGASKLLVYKNGKIGTDYFHNLRNYLPHGTMLVFNNTKVMPARLLFSGTNNAAIEVLCIKPREPSNYEDALQSAGNCVWTCIVGNRRRWKEEVLRKEFNYGEQVLTLCAQIVRNAGVDAEVEFRWDALCSFAQVLTACGAMPLPPYLHRTAELADYDRYQTIYAQRSGSAAAPTAGLHFSDSILSELKAENSISTAELTLHVGAGTFLPVKTATANDHTMHSEYCCIPAHSVESMIAHSGTIFAVGTTTARALESMYWIGANLVQSGELLSSLEQWHAYRSGTNNISMQEALGAILNYLKRNHMYQLEFSTSLMIMPYYKYQIISGLITNFHQPQSTLLLLVAAAVGNKWRSIYEYALQNDYRFLSYGDSSLLFLHS